MGPLPAKSFDLTLPIIGWTITRLPVSAMLYTKAGVRIAAVPTPLENDYVQMSYTMAPTVPVAKKLGPVFVDIATFEVSLRF